MAERPEDLNLPTAVISRIVKDNIPSGVLVSKEARSAIARAASVFVLYATTTALSITHSNKKKTLAAPDVIAALEEMEFGSFIEPLKESLERHRKIQQDKKDSKKAKKQVEKEKEVDSEPMDADVTNVSEQDKENDV